MYLTSDNLVIDTLPGLGLDLIGKAMSIDPDSLTTRVHVHGGPYTAIPYQCVPPLDYGPPQTLIQESNQERMKQAGAATAACETFTAPRVRDFRRVSKLS